MIDERIVDGHRLMVQTEYVRGEGTWAYVTCCTCVKGIETRDRSCEVLKRNREIVRDFFGRGATAAARKRLRDLK